MKALDYAKAHAIDHFALALAEVAEPSVRDHDVHGVVRKPAYPGRWAQAATAKNLISMDPPRFPVPFACRGRPLCFSPAIRATSDVDILIVGSSDIDQALVESVIPAWPHAPRPANRTGPSDA